MAGTLPALHKECKENGYNLSKTGLYYYFEPRNWSTTEGQRHIKAKELGLNIKLLRAQNSARKEHPAHNHCMRIRRDGEIMASILGKNECLVLSMDDKCKVPVGIAAAVKQTPLIMCASRRVKLPDHSFAVGPGHKLTPSVIVAPQISYDKTIGVADFRAVRAIGPIYVANRSMAHSKSSPFTHGYDLEYLLTSDKEQFKAISKGSDSKVKPVWIISNDGGADLQGMFCFFYVLFFLCFVFVCLCFVLMRVCVYLYFARLQVFHLLVCRRFHYLLCFCLFLYVCVSFWCVWACVCILLVCRCFTCSFAGVSIICYVFVFVYCLF